MHRESEEPLRALREKVAAEREILEGLRQRFNEPSMKESVDSVLLDLNDVENVFITTLDTSFAETEVIRNAGIPLQMAISKRKKLQQYFAQYGANAILFSADA